MSRLSKIWRGVQSVIVGSALVTKASAAILPSNAIPETVAQWNMIRKDIPNQVPNRMLPQDLLTLLGEVIAKQTNLREAIHQSYASVARQDIQHLDDFWLSQPTITKDTATFNTFLEIRMQVTGSFGESSPHKPYVLLASASSEGTSSESASDSGQGGGSSESAGGSDDSSGSDNDSGGGDESSGAGSKNSGAESKSSGAESKSSGAGNESSGGEPESDDNDDSDDGDDDNDNQRSYGGNGGGDPYDA